MGFKLGLITETARSTVKKWVPGLSFLALFVCACSAQDRSRDLRAKKPFPVSSHCYLSTFEPNQFPWKETDCLNYEEAFQKHTYFEVQSDSGAQPVKVKVKKFVRGSKVEEFNLIAVPDRDEWTVQVTND